MSEVVLGLAVAKLAVMQRVPYLRKTKTQGLTYSFASERQLLAKLHPVFVELGLTWAPVAVQLERSEVYQTGKGASMNRVIVRVTYRLAHAASGQSEDVAALGEGADVGDKATSKAMTAALKYALRQSFLVETGDDPDRQPSAPQERATQPANGQDPAAAPAPGPAELIDAGRIEQLTKALYGAGRTWARAAAWLSQSRFANGFPADGKIDQLTVGQADALLRILRQGNKAKSAGAG